MNIVAVIPARGGSKGIPNKNIRIFNGKPLIATSIEAAISSKFVNKIYVSTDSKDIAKKSLEYGAEVLIRPSELANDIASSESALLNAIEQIEGKGDHIDLLVFLQCTAPFITSQDIDGTISKLIEDNADSALAVVPFNHFLWINDENGAKGINHDGKYRKRRQDLIPQYLETGSVYVVKVNKFKEEKTRFCGKTTLYEIDDSAREHEIDDASEFFVAEAKLEWLSKSKKEKENYRLRAKTLELEIPNIKALVLDFDGIFTDDSVYVDEFGKETVKCNRSDGMGIELLKNNSSIQILVISSETNSCVIKRCNKLNVNVINSCKSKLESVKYWSIMNNISLDEIMYCGNDLNDLPMVGKVGLFVCPASANVEIKRKADLILGSEGGKGFVREVTDMLLGFNKFPKKCFYKPSDTGLRPWGKWQILSCGYNECIKLITVNPSLRISYQSHNHRDELWFIKTGSALVTIDGKDTIVSHGESIYIEKTKKHRIKNLSESDILEIIEIQKGEFLEEADITRYEDDFGRIE